MRILGVLADIINTKRPEPLYGIFNPEPATPEFNATPVIIISAVCVGVVAGIIMLVKKSLKNREINNAQALYGPPQMFNKPNELDDKSKVDVIDDNNQKEE